MAILWQTGQPYPDDLPSGHYQFTYRVSKLYNLPTVINHAADAMCNIPMRTEDGSESIEFNGYTCNFPLASIYGYVTFDATVQGISPVAAIALILGLMVALGIVAIFVEKNLYKITDSPAGQVALGSISAAVLIVAASLAYLLFKGRGTISNPFQGAK